MAHDFEPQPLDTSQKVSSPQTSAISQGTSLVACQWNSMISNVRAESKQKDTNKEQTNEQKTEKEKTTKEQTTKNNTKHKQKQQQNKLGLKSAGFASRQVPDLTPAAPSRARDVLWSLPFCSAVKTKEGRRRVLLRPLDAWQG